MAHKLISKADAKRLGLKTYFTGKPCPKGHIDEIFVNGRCRTCTLEGTAAIRKRNKAKIAKTRPTKGRAVSTAVAALEPVTPITAEDYADKITDTWEKAAESIIATGKLLIEAKEKLQHGDFGDMLAMLLPFSERTAQMLMAIAANPVLSDAKHASDLPPHWYTLYQLTKFDDDVLLAKIEDRTINPGMERKHVALITGEIHPEASSPCSPAVQ